ncbi:MAG: DUF4411 family protein [Candidatus Zixiibacteriota bacterium]
MGTTILLRFPKIWKRIGELVQKEKFWSVREVRRELENNCPFAHIDNWVRANRSVFRKPTAQELDVVSQIFQRKEFLGLVKRANVRKGLPVADPFIVAAARVHKASVVTREYFKAGGARIPTVCKEFDVKCINVEQFLAREKLKY